MTIQVKRVSGTRLKVVSGQHRVSTQLAINGKADVQDIDTGEKLAAHRVDGEIVVLTSPAAAAAQSAAAAVISKAAKL